MPQQKGTKEAGKKQQKKDVFPLTPETLLW